MASTERGHRLTRARLILAGFGWRVFLRRFRWQALAVVLAAGFVGALAAVVVLATSSSSHSSPAPPLQPYSAALPAVPTNHVTGSGTATVKLRGLVATVTLDTNGIFAGGPHLAHIHGEGTGNCPTAASARLHNGHLAISTGDAIRLYGSTLTSFTLWGSTSGSVPNNIDMNRYPAGANIRYQRTMTVSKLTADLIRDGDAVIVVHGIDYNDNGVYDFQALGVSDLDQTLPGEATAPALCGPLRLAPGARSASVRSATTFVASLSPDPLPATAPSATGSLLSEGGPRPDGFALLCHPRQAETFG